MFSICKTVVTKMAESRSSFVKVTLERILVNTLNKVYHNTS